MNFDIRDLNFWYKQAQKKLITDQIKSIQAVRLAMDAGDSYSKALNEYQSQLRELEIGKEKFVQESWEDLKMLGKGK